MMNSDNNKTSLNIAGKLTELFLHSKITILIIIGSILFGLMALLFTPRTYNPEIVVPVVNISVNRAGSNAQEMLRQIVRPLEGLMGSIPGVDHTYGMAVNDNALVTVRFKVNENEENSLVKVYNQINSNLNRIPAGTLPPLIQSVSLYDVPLVTLTLSSSTRSFVELREIAAKVLDELRSVPSVGKSWVAGSSESAVRVWLDPEKLAAYYIPIKQIKQALISNNVGLNAGTLDSKTREIPLRVNAEFMTPEDVGKTIVGVWNGKPVYLRDVSRIEMALSDDNVRSYFADGRASTATSQNKMMQPAVTIALARQKGSNGVVVADAILKKMAIIKEHSLPKDIQVSVTRNYGEDANDAVNTLIEHLGVAILAVVIILLLFLGWRESSIVVLSIPLILFLVLGVGWLSGQTINRITLFALILSLGLLVDDSIVVIENIHRHMMHRAKRNFSQLIIFAANEIGKPTIIATFTVILALAPMAYVTGMMGPFMAPIPFNAPVAMFISLIIAYTVVPYLAYRWLKNKADAIANQTASSGDHEKAQTHDSLLHRLYLKMFQPLMINRSYRHRFYFAIVLLLALVMLQPLWQFIRPGGANGPLSLMGVELKMLPDDNVNTFLIEIDAALGTELVQTSKMAKDVMKVLAKNQYITNYQLFYGESAPVDFAAMVRGDALQHGSHYAQIRVNLINKHHRSIGSHQIAQELYGALAAIEKQYPNAHIKLFETPPGPPVRSQMEGAIYGPDYHLLRTIASDVTQTIYPDIYGMINIDNSITESLPEYRIIVDRNKSVMAGILPSVMSDEIEAYFRGVSVGAIHQPQAREPENIMLRLPRVTRENANSLFKLYLSNRQSQLVPLAKIASINRVIQEKPIFTRDQYPVVYVTGEMLHSSPVYAVTTVTKELNGKLLSDGTRLEVNNLGFHDAEPKNITQNQFFWQGEMRLTLDVFRDLGAAFIVALLLIYLLLTAFYRSFMIPVIIMGAIPLTIIGVFPGHWLMNQPFTATSMIGVIALAGIVVRNSLLLIDFIIERQRQGESLEAAVMHSGVVRLLSIILTALAIILGSAVMLSDPVFGGLAISLIFGAFASTTLTLFAIPLVYYSWKRRRQ